MSRLALIEPVIYLGVRATRILSLAPRNRNLYAPTGEAGWDWKTLLAHFQARLSADSVYGLDVNDEHRPEKGWRKQHTGHLFRGDTARSLPRNGAPHNSGIHLPRRPLWLLETPKLLKTRNDVPYWHGLLSVNEGPERIEGGWWDEAHVARDYYIAVNPANQRCWIYRELNGSRRWYLHGMFE